MMVTKCIRCGRRGGTWGPPGAWYPNCPMRGIDHGGPGVGGVLCDFRKVWDPPPRDNTPESAEVEAWQEAHRLKREARLDEASAAWEKMLSARNGANLADLLKQYPTSHVQWETNHHALLREAADLGITVHVYRSQYGSIVTCVAHGGRDTTKFSSDYSGCDHMLFECQLKPLLEKERYRRLQW